MKEKTREEIMNEILTRQTMRNFARSFANDGSESVKLCLTVMELLVLLESLPVEVNSCWCGAKRDWKSGDIRHNDTCPQETLVTKLTRTARHIMEAELRAQAEAVR